MRSGVRILIAMQATTNYSGGAHGSRDADQRFYTTEDEALF